MKKLLLFSSFSAVYFVLAASEAYGAVKPIGICESLFAPSELKRDLRTSRKAAESRANRGWQEAKADGRPSIDIDGRQRVFTKGQAESPWIDRLPNLFDGDFYARAYKEDKTHVYFEPSGKGIVVDGQRYIEFPNSTMFTTRARNGDVRTWVITRFIRPYKNKLNRITGEQGPDGYVSDFVLSELIDGKAHIQGVFVKSVPERKLFLEDPRAAKEVNPNDPMKPIVNLFFTDYSSHKDVRDNPDKNPDVMNRYLEIKVDEDGVPLKPNVDSTTGLPENMLDLSPVPVKRKDGLRDERGELARDSKGDIIEHPEFFELDAKNGTVTSNAFGESVALTRLRPNPNDPEMIRLFDGDVPDYSMQSFIFASREDRLNYDWRDAAVDMVGRADSEKTYGKVRPVKVAILRRNKDMEENLEIDKEKSPDAEIRAGEKGLGPGTPILHMRRVGDFLLGSETPEGPWVIMDMFKSKAESEAYPIAANADPKVQYPVWWPHNIRKINQKTPTGVHKLRHYTVDFQILSPRMDRIIHEVSDVIQPNIPEAKGKGSGILDLMHEYLMGYALAAKNAFGRRLIYVDDAMIAKMDQLHKTAQANPQEIANYQKWKGSVLAKYGQSDLLLTGGQSDSHTPLFRAGIKGLMADALKKGKKN